jgi:phosphohistidine phosphatase
MDIYLIRHAEAVELGQEGAATDFDRPLTANGQAQAEKLAKALPERGVKIERLFVSPLVRSQQTAAPLIAAWGLSGDGVVECSTLAPGGSSSKLARRIRKAAVPAIGLVGHRPDLNEFAAWLIGSKKALLALDKGGVALVRVEEDELEKGAGELIWLLPHAMI